MHTPFFAIAIAIQYSIGFKNDILASEGKGYGTKMIGNRWHTNEKKGFKFIRENNENTKIIA